VWSNEQEVPEAGGLDLAEINTNIAKRESYKLLIARF